MNSVTLMRFFLPEAAVLSLDDSPDPPPGKLGGPSVRDLVGLRHFQIFILDFGLSSSALPIFLDDIILFSQCYRLLGQITLNQACQVLASVICFFGFQIF